MSEIDDIKAKLNIVDLIREYIPVKAVGANFQALCPFHNEKTPSFVISPDKQIWHCFGCGRGGDIFSFIMEKEGLDFSEALHLLATKAGVELRQHASRDKSKLNRLLDIMKLAGKYYAHVLESQTGKSAQDYLLKRGLKAETITDWSLGYAPDKGDSLYNFLSQRPQIGPKYTAAEMEAAGLILKSSRTGGRSPYYDRFRGRIMFPIWDFNNNLVAFTARISPEKEKTEKTAKYINSPQTEIYDKSRVLFGLNKAKGAIREEDLVVVVEGQMDAISCHNHGIYNVVASSGTALTRAQIALLKRFTKNIALAFDMDAAGQQAVDRGIREVLAQEMNVKIITLNSGKDPDESLRQNPNEFKEAIKAAQPMLDYYFLKISTDLNLDKLDNKILVRNKMFAMIQLVPNKVEQGYWLKKISEELDFSESDIREEFVKYSTSLNYRGDNIQGEEIKNNEKAEPILSREEMLSELVLALVIKFPQFIPYLLDNLDIDRFYGERNVTFYKTLIIYYNKAALFSYEDIKDYLKNDDDLLKLLDRLLLLGEKEYYNHNVNEAREELIKISQELKRYYFQKKIKGIEKEIIILEKQDNFDKEKMGELMANLKNATEELKKLM
ncbi:MAG: DNA primase [Patescibacteria group bacterium]|nr:DNA primase [Patescibacteria group bacterium]